MAHIPIGRAVGLAQGMIDLLNDLKTRMVAASVDPTADITQLGTDMPAANHLNTEQEALKQELHAKTEELGVACDALVTSANQAGDKIIACFGKNSAEAKRVENLRAALRVKTRTETPPANPTPPAP